MSIKGLFKTIITVTRQVYTGDKSALSTIGTINGHIQQLTQDRIVNFAGNLDVDYAIWCDQDANVKVSDILVAGGINYEVKKIQDYNITPTGNNQHLELLAKKTG